MSRLLVFALIAAVVTACGAGDVGQSAESQAAGGSTAAPSQPTDQPTEETTPTPRPTQRPTPRPTPASEHEDLVVAEYGFTANAEFENATYAVIIENSNPDWLATSVSINITFYDASGTVLTTSDEYLYAVLPGSKAAQGGAAYDAGTATEMEVTITQPEEYEWERVDAASLGSWAFERVTTTNDDYGGHKTTGLIVSSFEEAQEGVEVTAVYRDAAGAILGGEFTFVDSIPPMGQAAFEMNTFLTIPGLTTTEMYADIGTPH